MPSEIEFFRFSDLVTQVDFENLSYALSSGQITLEQYEKTWIKLIEKMVARSNEFDIAG